MSDNKKSLRRKKSSVRPVISHPRQISHRREPSADSKWDVATTASGNTGLSIPGNEQRKAPSIALSVPGNNNTSELVKRRYSARLVGQQQLNWQDGSVPPPMPSLPAQYASSLNAGGRVDKSPSRDGKNSDRGSGKLKVDIRALKDPNLQAENYVRNFLAEASEGDIHSYQKELQSIKSHTSTDLQANVYQNRTQFIKISKEADRLKSEMRTLRTLMGELTTALGQATNAAGPSGAHENTLSAADRKRMNRSSVANLEAMWSTHLQVLWKRVEGSQKYLPALPGRHIILESQRWVELNAATWKPRRRVALVLLNDHLLVASEKKRSDLVPSDNDVKSKRQSRFNAMGGATGNTSAPSQSRTVHVADRCWALQDVLLADISNANIGHASGKEHAAMRNAINIRGGKESFTYATPDSAEKAGLLVAFRKAQEDLRKQVSAEHAKRGRELDDVAATRGRDSRLLKRAAAADYAEQAKKDPAAGLNRSNSVLVDSEGRQRNVRWVESQIDSLDISIAMQGFEDSVAKVEQLRKLIRGIRSNAAASEIIVAKVDERASRLASCIGRQLSLTSAGVERTKQNVSWLLRLDYEEMARTCYLESRTATIRVRTRQLPFTGPLPPYLHALTFTTFTLLLHTFRTFAASFPPPSGSAVVKWAKERVEEFNELLDRQFSSIERGTALWKECVETVRAQSGVLAEVGVDFRILVARGLLDEQASTTSR